MVLYSTITARRERAFMKRTVIFLLCFFLAAAAALADSARMPDGTEFPMWEKPLHFSKNVLRGRPGEELPMTMARAPRSSRSRRSSKAAQVLQPGERVVIAEGVYREFIRPARGGTGPDAMISYEAAPGAKVVVKGSAVVTDWKPSEGWNFGIDPKTQEAGEGVGTAARSGAVPQRLQPVRGGQRARQSHLAAATPRTTWRTYFRRRGLVFVDGQPLEPVETAERTGRAFAAVDELLHEDPLDAALQGVLSRRRAKYGSRPTA